MSQKSKTQAAPGKASVPSRAPSAGLAQQHPTPFLGLPQTLGNQAMLQLLESGVIRAKLRVSQPGDPDEVEADRVAEKVVSASRAPAIHRKCACDGGTPCAKCAEEREEETVHRSLATPHLRSPLSLQRSPADPTSTADPVPAAPEKQPPGAKVSGTLVVEDNATKLEPYQMRKSQFIALLRTEACAAADAALASVKHTTKGCPYVAKWLSFYEKQSSEHIERTIRKYAPEAAKARSAREAIGLIVARVERAAITWAKTGKVEGVPKELASEVPGQGGVLGAVQSIASSKVGSAVLGFIGGTKKQEPAGGGEVQRKAQSAEAAASHDGAPAHDAAGVKAQLGSGHSLDSRVRSQMSSAFGHDFSGVRVHTDAHAAKLSSDLQARAFTVGNDVAFASGEYRPGTPIGDALIAHELAHVVQQSGGNAGAAPQRKSEGDDNALERDADQAAVGAMASGLTQGRMGVEVVRGPVPRLKSGLRLSRCKDEKDKDAGVGLERLKVCVRPVRIAEDDGSRPTVVPSFADAQNIWGKCCIDVSVNSPSTVSKHSFKELDEKGNSNTPSAEEQALFTAAGGGGGCISVFVADIFNDGTTVSKDVAGGGHSYNSGSADPRIVVVEGVEPTIVAHEMGHAMGYSFALGIQAHQPAGTVMEVTGNTHDHRESTKVAPVICEQVRKFVGATGTGKKDCTQST